MLPSSELQYAYIINIEGEIVKFIVLFINFVENIKN